MPEALTARQQAFVREYLIDMNAAQAAIRAGYSEKAARSVSARLLTYANIKNAIDVAMKERGARTEVTQDMVIRELCKIAFFDIRRLYNDDGSLKKIHEIDSEIAAAISGVDVTEITSADSSLAITKKIKMSDKLRALDLLGKHLGMFVERHEHSGSIDVPTLKVVLGG